MNLQPNPYLSATADPRSVYVHIPFCRHRCGYCNFALVAGRDKLIDPFFEALENEIHSVQGVHDVDTLFLGGGTPSHLSNEHLERLGEILFSKFQLTEHAEFSAECNPGDVTEPLLDSFLALGVNRISLGVQSFNADKLKILERDHDEVSAKKAFDLAMKKIGNVSMDLIFATPGESRSDWKRDLETALALEPSHLSTYELTWEKGTTFWNRKSRGELHEANDQMQLEMYRDAIEMCNSRGLAQYEVSSFAKQGLQCQHNLQYWLGNPWFAFGPSAASFVGGVRKTNHRSPTTWMKRARAGQTAVEETEVLSDQDRAIERIVFGLRMVGGINVEHFESASGATVEELTGETVQDLQKRGLLERCGPMLKLTEAGLMIADTVAAELL